MNTACGNTLINFLMLSYIVCDTPGAKFVCEGDDAVIFVPAERMEGMPALAVQRALELGFKLKCQIAQTLDKVDYCSGNILSHGDGVYTHLRSMPKPLFTDCYTSKKIGGPRDLRAHASAASMSASLMYAGQPVMASFAAYLKRSSGVLGPGDVEAAFTWWQREVVRLLSSELDTPCLTCEARSSFALITGWTPEHQKMLEACLDSQ